MIRRITLILTLALFSAVAPAEPLLTKTRSQHYQIHSDMDQELVTDLARRLDAMSVEYARRLSDFGIANDRRPLDVYLFSTKSDYLKFTGGKFSNTGGIFMPGKNQLAAYLEGQRDTLRRTLQHEAFHQFIHKAIGPNVPIWLNEGLAQLFEEGVYTGDQFLMGQVPPRRLRQLQSDIRTNKLMGFKTMLAMSPERWTATLAADANSGSTQYNQAWAMIHFMAYGDDGRNGTKLVTLLKHLANGKNADESFTDAFGNNLEALRVKFDEYALALQPTTEAAMIDRHEVLADLCAQLKDRGKVYKDVESFRKTVDQSRYKLRYTRGQVTWTAEPASYFRDGNNKLYGATELYFEPRAAATLPDLVFKNINCRIVLRARFFENNGKTEYEVLVESPTSTAATN